MQLGYQLGETRILGNGSLAPKLSRLATTQKLPTSRPTVTKISFNFQGMTKIIGYAVVSIKQNLWCQQEHNKNSDVCLNALIPNV